MRNYSDILRRGELTHVLPVVVVPQVLKKYKKNDLRRKTSTGRFTF